MFKRRNADKKVDLNKDIESIEVSSRPLDKRTALEKSLQAQKIANGEK